MVIIRNFLEILLGSEVVYKALKSIYYSRLFPYVQVVTYHDTPEKNKDSLRDQFRWYNEQYVNCDLSDLRGLLINGVWEHDKPGLIISFDDGLRSNFEVALPLLEEYGFTGFFMIPAGFVNTDCYRQKEFAIQNLIDFCAAPNVSRIALSWDEVAQIESRGHEVTCHSMNHRRLSKDLSEHELSIEIAESKYMLEYQLGHSVDSFTWVGGEEWAYCRAAHEMILRANYELVFCTNCAPITGKQSPYFLQRYHVEPNYMLKSLRFVLGGFYDLKYFRKRRRTLKKLMT
jgi:peptidoglycan/xylan/chitin deacetylase (PgdA/CDA1 family)